MARRVLITGLPVVVTFLWVQAATAAGVWYVDQSATGTNAGTSWADAFVELQSALAVAQAGDEIRVAAGTYKPDYDVDAGVHTGARWMSFALVDGVGVYGAFPPGGGDGIFDARDPNNPDYESILSGDLAGNDEPNFVNYDENAYTVVYAERVGSDALLDGFTVTGGNSNNVTTDPLATGGGMWSDTNASPSIVACRFVSNRAEIFGGGLTLYGGGTVINCAFAGNMARFGGGGVYKFSRYGQPTFVGCLFSGNTATEPSARGGGMVIAGEGSSLITITFVDCVFSDNAACGEYAMGGGLDLGENTAASLLRCRFSANHSFYGGGLSIFGRSPALELCVFENNTATRGGGVACLDWIQHGDPASNPMLKSCTFVGNYAVEYGGGWLASGAGLPILVNCTFTENSADISGGGLGRTPDYYIFSSGHDTLASCILWNDSIPEIYVAPGYPEPVASFSDIQGGWPGEGNIDADPLFVVPPSGDLRLTYASPCKNAGDPAYPVTVGDQDAAGRQRVVYGRVDMGAYEYYCRGDLNGDGVVDFRDLMVLLSNYKTPNPVLFEDGDFDDDGDVDLADLDDILSFYGDTCP